MERSIIALLFILLSIHLLYSLQCELMFMYSLHIQQAFLWYANKSFFFQHSSPYKTLCLNDETVYYYLYTFIRFTHAQNAIRAIFFIYRIRTYNFAPAIFRLGLHRTHVCLLLIPNTNPIGDDKIKLYLHSAPQSSRLGSSLYSLSLLYIHIYIGIIYTKET